MKVELRSVRLVAAWTWDAGDDACGICRNPFDACCPDCRQPGDDCPILWGVCSHPFHQHCILKWVNAQPPDAQKCPMCRQDWKVKPIPKPHPSLSADAIQAANALRAAIATTTRSRSRS